MRTRDFIVSAVGNAVVRAWSLLEHQASIPKMIKTAALFSPPVIHHLPLAAFGGQRPSSSHAPTPCGCFTRGTYMLAMLHVSPGYSVVLRANICAPNKHAPLPAFCIWEWSTGSHFKSHSFHWPIKALWPASPRVWWMTAGSFTISPSVTQEWPPLTMRVIYIQPE